MRGVNSGCPRVYASCHVGTGFVSKNWDVECGNSLQDTWVADPDLTFQNVNIRLRSPDPDLVKCFGNFSLENSEIYYYKSWIMKQTDKKKHRFVPYLCDTFTQKTKILIRPKRSGSDQIRIRIRNTRKNI
jgi:hypothetical protein